MVKKQQIFALLLFVLIPAVTVAGGTLANLINPEIAVHTSNYVRNYHLLDLLKTTLFLGSIAVAGLLWLLACVLIVRSKQRSYVWLLLVPSGPIGIAVLAMLNDRAPDPADRYARFVQNLRLPLRIAYEVATFLIVWVLAWQAMLLNRMAIIQYQAITTGVSTQQIIDIQNASSGMWAFAEGNEVFYLVALFYLLRPIAFALIAAALAARTSRPPGSPTPDRQD